MVHVVLQMRMAFVQWISANATWRALSFRAMFSTNPWTAFTLFVLVSLVIGQVAVFVWFYGVYAHFVAQEFSTGSVRAYSLPLIAWSALFTYVFGAIDFNPSVGRFWVIESSPIPRAWRALDRVVSSYTFSILGLVLLIAAAVYSGYPVWSGASLFAWLLFLSIHTRKRPLFSILLASVFGFFAGWLFAFMLSELLHGDMASMNGGIEGIWSLFGPLIKALPMPCFLDAFLGLPNLAHVVLAAAGFLAAVQFYPLDEVRGGFPGQLVYRKVGCRFNVELAHAALSWLGNYQSGLGAAAAVAAYRLATRWFDVPHLALNQLLWLLAVAAVSPLFRLSLGPLAPIGVSDQGDDLGGSVGVVIRSNTTEIRAAQVFFLRGKLEWLGLWLVPLLLYTPLWTAAIALGVWLGLVWWAAPALVRWPLTLVFLLVVVGGMGVLWLF